LTRWTEKAGVVDLCAIGFVIPWTGHVWLSAGDGCELVVELLDYCLVGVYSV
jgi:hypothetical protein